MIPNFPKLGPIRVGASLISITVMLSFPLYAQEADVEPSVRDLDFLVGKWVGQAKNYHAYRTDREPTFEDVTKECFYILKDNYIQCNDTLTSSNGNIRTIRIHYNYNTRRKAYQTLFLYDNWHRHLSYLMNINESSGNYTGILDLHDEDHGAGFERIVWQVSEDGKEYRAEEFINRDTGSGNPWVLGFETVLRKVE